MKSGPRDKNGLLTSGRYQHGLSYTPEYRCWQTMRLRCYEPTNAAYKDYGARGITVCDRWRESPANFLADMGPKPSAKHELDRENNDEGYSPENCRWVTRKVNDRNRRSNRFLEFNGERLTMAEWAERYGMGRDTLSFRIRKGWTVGDALTTPRRVKSPNGHAKPTKTPCIECGSLSAGLRCKSCENKARPKRKASALALKEAA